MPPSTPPIHRRRSLLVGGCTPPRSLPRMGSSTTMVNRIHHTTTSAHQHNNVRVVVRIRPMNAEEERRSCQVVLYPNGVEDAATVETSTTGSEDSSDTTTPASGSFLPVFRSRKTDPTKQQAHATSCYTETLQRQFDFHAVYGPQVSQPSVYADAVGDAVAMNIFEGYNTTILAYGMTGSGKTYTMSERDGVIARAVDDIFQGKANREAEGQEVLVRMSSLEIYTDELFDLLSDSPEDLKLRDHGDSVSVVGLTNVQVENEAEVRELLERAGSHRTTGCTRLNERSSRSHAVYTLSVYTNKGGDENPVTAKLTLVDLAGSERIKASGVEGEQRRESIHINTDLFVLGKVVNALSTGMPHVPYRDSKLTRLLRDALGGNSRTVLIACVSPADLYAEESINTLRYAERTQSITNYCKQNTLETLLTPAQCAALQNENRLLKIRVNNLMNRVEYDNADVRALELSNLEKKLHTARAEAKAARRSCSEIAQQADQFKERYERLSQERSDSDSRNIAGDPFAQSSSELSRQLRILVDEKNRQYKDLLDHIQQIESTTSANDQHTLKDSVRRIVDSIEINDCGIQDLSCSVLGASNSNTIGSRKELEARCDSLNHDIELVNSENDILQQQNRKLQEEVQRLQEELSSHQDAAQLMEVQTPKRSQTDRILDWADKEIEKERQLGCSDQFSTASSIATELRPRSAQKSPSFTIPENDIVLSDMSKVHHEAASCPCQDTIFTNKPDYVDFYLPDVRVLCSCGKGQESELVGDDPCLLVNILRQWQVEFLLTQDISTAAQLVEAAAARAKRISQKMRLWRKQRGLLSVKTRSCKVAIHIWARTCKAVLKAAKRGQRPQFLNVSLPLDDDATVSTLGFSVSRLSDIDEGD